MMKSSAEGVVAILVGGGSVILPDKLKGVSELIRPPHYDVANAVGAAISQVSASADVILALPEEKREERLAEV